MSQLKLPIILPLTVALLAVSGYGYYRAQARQAATLARIAALDTCLAACNGQRARAASNTILSVADIVRKVHNQAADVAVLRQAQQIQDSTQAFIAKLHQLRHLWQGAGSKTELGALPAQADQYKRFIRRYVPEAPPLTEPSPQTATVGWLGEFDTAKEPTPASLALLTKLETQVRQVEIEALNEQALKVFFEGVFDKLSAFAAPTSETVASGAVYQAQLMLVQATSNGRMRFSADGQEIPINPATGQGSVEFRVPAARPGPPDTVRAEWHGRVQMPWGAADTTLEATVPYFIVKPHSR